MSKDIFVEICETLRLAELKRYTDAELLAELQSRGVSIETPQESETPSTDNRQPTTDNS